MKTRLCEKNAFGLIYVQISHALFLGHILAENYKYKIITVTLHIISFKSKRCEFEFSY